VLEIQHWLAIGKGLTPDSTKDLDEKKEWAGAERTRLLSIQLGIMEFGKYDISSAKVSICTFIWDGKMLFTLLLLTPLNRMRK